MNESSRPSTHDPTCRKRSPRRRNASVAALDEEENKSGTAMGVCYAGHAPGPVVKVNGMEHLISEGHLLPEPFGGED